MSKKGTKYRPSGAFDSRSLLVSMVIATGTGLVAAVIYGYAILYSPFVYINIMLPVGFGTLIAKVFEKRFVLTPMRNPLVGVLATIPVAIIAWAASWMVWLLAVLQRFDQIDRATESLLSLQGTLQLIIAINETGLWSVKGITVSGAALAIIWIIEAFIILSLPALGAWKVAQTPFCEHCGSWCEEQKGIRTIANVRKSDLIPRLLAGDIAYIKGLPSAAQTDERVIRFDLWQCPCTKTNVLNLLRVRPEEGSDSATWFLRPERLLKNQVLQAEFAGSLR